MFDRTSDLHFRSFVESVYDFIKLKNKLYFNLPVKSFDRTPDLDFRSFVESCSPANLKSNRLLTRIGLKSKQFDKVSFRDSAKKKALMWNVDFLQR